MDVYVTGKKGSKNALVIHYDIFGDHPCTRQVADILGLHGFRVAMPDLCRGNPWPANIWPPESKEQVFKHITGVAPYEKVLADLTTTVNFLKDEGSEKFGMIGLCWGGKNGGALSCTTLFHAVALVHPSLFDVSVLENTIVPLAFLPASNDADFLPHFEAMKSKAFADLVIHKRYTDVPHGFCGARADFADEVNVKRTNECIRDMHDFFLKAFAKA
ncbi:hypothetical protein HDU97_000479 [Phlyctochytrium planicorne]|nr:hypothetical protein HDU97_000479 [Phlyctochytrium planicorne]